MCRVCDSAETVKDAAERLTDAINEKYPFQQFYGTVLFEPIPAEWLQLLNDADFNSPKGSL